jgi:N-methylhydantoinase B
MIVAYISDGNINPAQGTRGGGAGGLSAQYRKKPDGSLEPLPACAEILIKADERMVSISAGGGGYGPPHERAVERVVHDVREGWISAERARDLYGVVLGDDLGIDEAATAERRAAMLSASPTQ